MLHLHKYRLISIFNLNIIPVVAVCLVLLLTPSQDYPRSAKSPTLGIVDHIYVISLPRRLDRRHTIQNLARFMGLAFEFWDATDANHPKINNILQHVQEQRTMDYKFQDSFQRNTDPLLYGSDYWALNSSSHIQSNSVTGSSIECTRGSPFHPPRTGHPNRVTFLTPAIVACWHSHLQAIRTIATQPNHTASLILEDDIDMEWDIEALLSKTWSHIPKDWDLIFLGHCWSNESNNDPVHLHSLLRPSFAPLCTHAYAVSVRGAKKLLDYLRHPALAYSRPIDQALAWLIKRRYITSFSIVPSIVIQARTDASDISSQHNGSRWVDKLNDSARLRMSGWGRMELTWEAGWWKLQY